MLRPQPPAEAQLPDSTTFAGLSLEVPGLFQTVKRFTPAEAHPALDALLTRYLQKEIGKTQVQIGLRDIAGREPLRQALLALVPEIDELTHRRELHLTVTSILDGSRALSPTERFHLGSVGLGSVGLLEACVRLGLPQCAQRLIDLWADTAAPPLHPDLDAGGALRQAMEGGAGPFAGIAAGLASIRPPRIRVVEALLRAGASIHVKLSPANPSPLEMAEARRREGRVEPGSAAALVLLTAHGWTPGLHRLMPAADRARVAMLLRLGYLLSAQPAWEAHAQAMRDVWRGHVLPHAAYWS